MATLRTDSNVETPISAVKSLRRDYALSITEAKTTLKKCRQALGQAPHAAPRGGVDVMPIRVPEIQIPVFSGNMAAFQTFRRLFSTVFDKTKIPEEQKLVHLMTKLTGEPYNLVKDLPITVDNYATAKDLLTKRYGNREATIGLIRNQLFALHYCKNLE